MCNGIDADVSVVLFGKSGLLMKATQDRPVFLNLLRIRQPVTAVVSIFHRISGFFLVLLIPACIYLLQLSLSSPEGFSQTTVLLDHQLTRVLGIFICWLLVHHFLAGIRFLLLDFDVGYSRANARKTAWMVHVGAILSAVIAAGVLL